MSNNNHETIFAVILAALICIVLIAGVSQMSFDTTTPSRNSPSEYVTVTVNSVNMQQNISSNSDGRTTSETVCMVYTDRGTYVIYQEGILAKPNLIGKMVPGQTVKIKFIKLNAPILGLYNIITDAI